MGAGGFRFDSEVPDLRWSSRAGRPDSADNRIGPRAILGTTTDYETDRSTTTRHAVQWKRVPDQGRGVVSPPHSELFIRTVWVESLPPYAHWRRRSGGESDVLIRRGSWVQLPPRRLNTNNMGCRWLAAGSPAFNPWGQDAMLLMTIEITGLLAEKIPLS